ncbi:Os03g0687800, partial [Oryza sativa Japonica Group]
AFLTPHHGRRTIPLRPPPPPARLSQRRGHVELSPTSLRGKLSMVDLLDFGSGAGALAVRVDTMFVAGFANRSGHWHALRGSDHLFHRGDHHHQRARPLLLRPIARAVLEASRMGRAPAGEQARIADEHLPYIEHWDAMWHELGRWRRRGEWGGPFTGVLRERANIGSAEEALAVVGWTFRQSAKAARRRLGGGDVPH